jgi:pilus assembly protein Flp/PilA
MNNTLLKLYVKMQTLAAREEGQDLVEYALVVGLISVFLVLVLKNVADDVNAIFSTIASQLTAAA